MVVRQLVSQYGTDWRAFANKAKEKGLPLEALRDVLELPWGFEIYSLLTRWNPLNLRRPLASGGNAWAMAR